MINQWVVDLAGQIKLFGMSFNSMEGRHIFAHTLYIHVYNYIFQNPPCVSNLAINP